MRILLVEDDLSTARSIELALATEGITCDVTSLGEEALEFAQLYDYDLIILDIMLPDMNGFEVLQQFRESQVGTPVLILSGLTGSDSKVTGLGKGADDYVTKPFNRGELVARIQAIVRRSKGHAQSILRAGDLEMDLEARTVTVRGVAVPLTSKEYSILELLMLRRGVPLKKDVFLNHLYGGIDEPDIKIIDVFICKLRKKLEETSGGENYIQTIWGRGYMIKEELGEEPEPAAEAASS